MTRFLPIPKKKPRLLIAAEQTESPEGSILLSTDDHKSAFRSRLTSIALYVFLTAFNLAITVDGWVVAAVEGVGQRMSIWCWSVAVPDRTGPHYVVPISGSVLSPSGYLGRLVVEKSTQMPGSGSGPFSVTIIHLLDNVPECGVQTSAKMDLLVLIPITISLSSLLIFDSGFIVKLGVIAIAITNGILALLLGPGTLTLQRSSICEVTEKPKPSFALLLEGDNVVVLKGEANVVDAITNGNFQLAVANDSVLSRCNITAAPTTPRTTKLGFILGFVFGPPLGIVTAFILQLWLQDFFRAFAHMMVLVAVSLGVHRRIGVKNSLICGAVAGFLVGRLLGDLLVIFVGFLLGFTLGPTVMGIVIAAHLLNLQTNLHRVLRGNRLVQLVIRLLLFFSSGVAFLASAAQKFSHSSIKFVRSSTSAGVSRMSKWKVFSKRTKSTSTRKKNDKKRKEPSKREKEKLAMRGKDEKERDSEKQEEEDWGKGEERKSETAKNAGMKPSQWGSGFWPIVITVVAFLVYYAVMSWHWRSPHKFKIRSQDLFAALGEPELKKRTFVSRVAMAAFAAIALCDGLPRPIQDVDVDSMLDVLIPADHANKEIREEWRRRVRVELVNEPEPANVNFAPTSITFRDPRDQSVLEAWLKEAEDAHRIYYQAVLKGGRQRTQGSSSMLFARKNTSLAGAVRMQLNRTWKGVIAFQWSGRWKK